MSLLIDYHRIINPHRSLLNHFIQIIKPVPNTKYSLGLILKLPQEQILILDKLPLGKKRILRLNHPDLIKSINGHSYTVFDRNKHIYEFHGELHEEFTNIPGPGSYARSANGASLYASRDVRSTSSGPWRSRSAATGSKAPGAPNATLWVGMDIHDPLLQKFIHKYVTAGFSRPYICKKSPLGINFSSHGLGLYKSTGTKRPCKKNVLTEIKYILGQFSNLNCQLKLQFSNNTINHFKNLLNTNNKEIAGTLSIKSKGILSFNNSSLILGKDETVDVAKGLYNFHTHPHAAYVRHGVKMAWPSEQDFIGFFRATRVMKTILHCVISLEGIYIISISKDNLKDNNKIIRFIRKSYHIKHKFGHGREAPNEYIKYVNSILYQNHPIFKVQFLSWQNAHKSFSVVYPKTGYNCFSKEEGLKDYERFY